MKKQTESDLVAEAVAYMRLHFARPLKLTKVIDKLLKWHKFIVIF